MEPEMKDLIDRLTETARMPLQMFAREIQRVAITLQETEEAALRRALSASDQGEVLRAHNEVAFARGGRIVAEGIATAMFNAMASS